MNTAAPIQVRLHPADGVAYGRHVPLTFGVPFADEVLPAGSSLRAVTADGRDLPVQTSCMTTWDKDLRFVKWLLVDLQADCADEEIHLDATADEQAPEPAIGITTEQDDGLLTIDTGVLRLRLRTQFDLWKHRETDSVFAGCQIKTTDGWRDVLHGPGILLYMKDQHGNVYDSLGVSPAPSIVVEESGPLRVCLRIDGYLRSAVGVMFCPYRLRLHLYAGKSDLRVHHTFIYNQDPTRVELAAIGMRVMTRPGDGARAAVGADADLAHWSANWRDVSILQSDDQHYEARLNGVPFGNGERFPGWASISGRDAGVVAVIRDGWQEYPKGFRVERDHLDVQIWPEQHEKPLSFLTPFSEPPLNPNGTRDEEQFKQMLAANPTAPIWLNGFRARTVEDFRWVETMIERHAADRVVSYDDPGVHNGIGAAKTTEVMLHFTQGPVDNEAAASLAASVQQPLTAVVDPPYLCATGALEHMYHAGDPRFANVDAFLDDGHFEFCVSDPVAYGRRYGMTCHGCLINLHGQEPGPLYEIYKNSDPAKAVRYFGPYNNEAADHILSVWCHFFRTGDPKHLRFAQLASRFTGDVAFVHAYPGDEDRIGVMHYHSGHPWAGVLCRSHSIVGGIMADYYMTGNRRSLDVAIEAADHVVRVQNPAGMLNCFYGNNLNREYTGPLSVLLEVYQATWQERYGILAERSLAWLLRASRNPGRLPKSIFTVGPRGDEAIVWSDGPPESHCGNHYMVYAPALRLFPSRELKDFLLAKADYFVWQHPRGAPPAAAMVSLAYDMTGNPDYAAYLADAIEGTKPSDPADSARGWRSFWMYTISGYLPRFLRTVAEAMDCDPDGFAEHVRQWRQKREKMPDRVLDTRPESEGETNLGPVSAEPFARVVVDDAGAKMQQMRATSNA